MMPFLYNPEDDRSDDPCCGIDHEDRLQRQIRDQKDPYRTKTDNADSGDDGRDQRVSHSAQTAGHQTDRNIGKPERNDPDDDLTADANDRRIVVEQQQQLRGKEDHQHREDGRDREGDSHPAIDSFFYTVKSVLPLYIMKKTIVFSLLLIFSAIFPQVDPS